MAMATAVSRTLLTEFVRGLKSSVSDARHGAGGQSFDPQDLKTRLRTNDPILAVSEELCLRELHLAVSGRRLYSWALWIVPDLIPTTRLWPGELYVAAQLRPYNYIRANVRRCVRIT